MNCEMKLFAFRINNGRTATYKFRKGVFIMKKYSVNCNTPLRKGILIIEANTAKEARQIIKNLGGNLEKIV